MPNKAASTWPVQSSATSPRAHRLTTHADRRTAADGGGALPHRRQQSDRQGPSHHTGIVPVRRRPPGGYHRGRRLMPVAPRTRSARSASFNCTPRCRSVVDGAGLMDRAGTRGLGTTTSPISTSTRARGERLGAAPVLPVGEYPPGCHRTRSAGRTFQAIADGLVADGIPTARRKTRWFPATIRAIELRPEATKRGRLHEA